MTKKFRPQNPNDHMRMYPYQTDTFKQKRRFLWITDILKDYLQEQLRQQW